MKKLVCLSVSFLLLFSIVVPFSAIAYEAPNLYDDFNDYSVGKLNNAMNWANTEEKPDAGGDIRIVQAGDGKQAKISVSYIQGAGSADSFMQSPIYTVDKPTTISGSIRNATLEQGNMNISLRDQKNGLPAGNLPLICLCNDGSKGKIVKYFPDILNVSESITNETWVNFSLTIHPETNELKIYRDGVLKATVPDFRTASSGKWAPFDFGALKMRISASVRSTAGAKVETYVDNISFFSNQSVEEGLERWRPEFAVYLEGSRYPVESIRSGDCEVLMRVKNLGFTAQDAALVVAHKKNGILQKVYTSDPTELKKDEIEELKLALHLDNPGLDDQLTVMLVESLNNLRPLAVKHSFVRDLVETPFQAEIKELYQLKTGGENVHPRIMASKQDFNRIRNETQNENVRKWKEATISSADTIVSKAMLYDTQAGDGKYFIGYVFSEGERLLEMSRRVKDFLTTLGMAYQLTGNNKYAEKAWKIMQRAGKPDTANPVAPMQFPDWHPVHYLDTAEMTAGFAIGYDWCYNYFTDAQRDYIVRSIKEYGVDLGEKAYAGQSIPGGNGWTKNDNNWNVVCGGGMTLGALSIADRYPDQAFFIVEKAVAGLKHMLPNFAPDGAWYEGPSYWHYTVQYLAKMITTLEQCLDTDFGIMNSPGIDKTGEFVLHLDGPTSINNFHDAGGGHVNSPEVFWLSNVFGNRGVTAAKLFNMKTYNQGGGALDLLWYDTSITTPEIQLEKDAYFRNAEIVTMRETWGDLNSLWLSYHAGKANISHSQLDCGTFVLDSQGVRWAEDLGKDEYTMPDYFGSKRWTYYRLRTEGHNTLLINPNDDGGQDLGADTVITAYSPEAEEPWSIADLSTAYPGGANSVLRGFKLTDNRKGLLIRDEVDLKKADSEIYWFMHFRSDNISTAINGNVVTMTHKNEKKMRLEFKTDAAQAEISVVPATTMLSLDKYPYLKDQDKNANYKKVQIKMKGSGKVNVTVKIRPTGTQDEFGQLDATPLKDWK